jgi:dethiobiotin synthase
VFGFKPIETGVVPGRDGEDQQLLCDAAGGWQSGELRGVYRFRQPAAPRVAAEAEGASIELARIGSVYQAGLRTTPTPEVVLVEGAGGWRVPITNEADTSTLAKAIGLPVLVVARAGLGTINHTLLTIEALGRRDVPIAGVVMVGPPDDVSRDNRLAIEQYGGVAVLGEMPVLNPLTDDRLRGWAETSLDAEGRLTDLLS